MWLRVLAGLVITSLLIGIIFTFLIYQSRAEQLKAELLFKTELQSVALESEISRLRNLTAQITSRSRIRQELEKYQQGLVDLQSLISFSVPKLADAMRLVPDMLSISRLDTNGKLLIQAGDVIPVSFWPEKFRANTIQLGIPQESDGEQLLVLSAPIFNRKDVKVGIDLVMFDIRSISDIIQSFIQRQQGSGNARIAVLQPTGVNYFYHSGEVADLQLERLFSAQMLAEPDEVMEHAHQLIGGGDETSILVHHKIGETGWLFLFYAKADDFFASAQMDAAYVAISVLILTLVGILLTLFLVRPLAGRISVESDGLRQLLQGREKLLEKARSSEKRFELAMQASSDGLWDWDLQTNAIYYSPRWKSMLGYEEHELENHYNTWEKLVDSDDKEEVMILIEECIAGGSEGFSIEFRMCHKDGHWVHILSHGISVHDEEGQVVRLVGTHVDLSERKKVEDELEAYQENLEQLVADRTVKLEEITAYNRTLFETSPIGLVLCDMEGKLVDMNKSYLKIIGYSEAEAKDLSYWDLTPRDYEAQEQLQLKSLEETGCYGPYEKEYQHKDGYRIPVLLNGIQIEQNGKPYIWSSVENITELRAKQQQLESIIENLPAVFYIKDKKGRHLQVNRLFEEATGLSKEQVIGRDDREIFPRETADAIVQRDQEVFVGKVPVTFEETVPHPDGTLHKYLSTKVPLFDEQGQVYALFGISADITQQKNLLKELSQARDKAEHLSQAKSEFLSNMSHEIRTPLNGVLGLARMGKHMLFPAKAQKLFAQITHSGEHLLQVVNDILDFSRIESGKLALENRAFKLTATVEDAVSLMAKEAGDKDLVISAQLAPDLPVWVKGDPLRLRQVLLNLLSNAVKFTEQGEVKLAVAAQEDGLHFRVSDTGIGMSEDQLTQLFKPFEQADSSTTRRFGGTGLGLSISYNLVKMMGGDIQVRSRLEQGSEFLLILPLQETKSETVSPVLVPPVGEQRLHGLRILAAEDVEINRLVLEDMLDEEGAHVLFAENGQQALDLLEEHGVNAFDIVLMDIQMPVMDGYTSAQHIHKIAPHLPVIGLTAHAMNEEKQRCLDSGMVDHVAKPFDIDVLVISILQHI